MSDNNDLERSSSITLEGVRLRLSKPDFDLYEFMNYIVDEMQRLTPATGAVVELVDGTDMVYRAASGTVKDYVGLRLPMENSITGLCVKNREVLRSDDTEQDPRVNLEACRKVGARSMVVAPLFHGGRAVGVVKIISDQPNKFKDEDVHTLQLIAGFIASGIANQLMQEYKNFF